MMYHVPSPFPPDEIALPDFGPFDRIYDRVNARMRDHADALSGRDQAWFAALIDGFQAERDRWGHDPGLEPYLEGWETLSSKLSNLTAGAYLHIAYDLPRVIADRFDPGHEARQERLFLEVTPMFSETFQLAAQRAGIVGYVPALGARALRGLEAVFGRSGAFHVAVQWVLFLRTAAWIHGRRLHRIGPPGSPGRADAERNMLRAMSAALADARAWYPMLAGALDPPPFARHAALSPLVPLALLPPVTIGGGWLATGLLLLLAGTLGGYVLLRRKQRAAHGEAIFIQLFGTLAARYVGFAVDAGRESSEDVFPSMLEKFRQAIHRDIMASAARPSSS